VYVRGDGEFTGPIRAGHFTNITDYALGRMKRVLRAWARRELVTVHAGFTSLSDLISEATVAGKRQDLPFTKIGLAGTTNLPNSLWEQVGLPGVGSGGGTSGTGRVTDRTTVGALGQTNPTGGDTLHLVNAYVSASVTGMVLGMYDRLWDMTYDHTAATSTPIDGNNLPDRYQTADLAVGNFIGSDITTNLSSNSRTITITYVDQDGNTAEASAAQTFNVATNVPRFWPTSVAASYFWPLNAGDRGVRNLTQIDQSTITSTTGVQNWWIGHMLGIFPCPVAAMPFQHDGINTAFNLQRIFDDACVTFFEFPKRSTSATSYYGLLSLVAG
jgi:hypothetical protein